MPESRGRTYRKTWRWIRLAQELKRTLPPVCAICGRHLDPNLPHNHRYAATVDHITELQDGGDPYDLANLTLVCRSCNSSKGNRNQRRRRQEQYRQQAKARELNPSRAW